MTAASKSSALKCCRCRKNKPSPGARRCRKCQDVVNTAQREKRAANKEAGMCACGRNHLTDRGTRCDQCAREQSKAKNVTYRKRKQAGLCHCGGKPRAGKKTCQTCADVDKRRRDAERRAVFEYYGLECACCREDIYEFLELDHIDGNGNDHRRETGYTTLYRWIIQHNFPEGFQTLCSNCNRAKHRYGECPHQRRAQTLKIG